MRIVFCMLMILMFSCSNTSEQVEYINEGEQQLLNYYEKGILRKSYLLEASSGDTLDKIHYYSDSSFKKISYYMLEGEGDYKYRETFTLGSHIEFKYFDENNMLREYYFPTNNPYIHIKLLYDKFGSLREFVELIKTDTGSTISNSNVYLNQDGSIDYNKSKPIVAYEYTVNCLGDSINTILQLTSKENENQLITVGLIEKGKPWETKEHRDMYQLGFTEDTVKIDYITKSDDYIWGGFISEGNSYALSQIVFFPLFYSIADSIHLPQELRNVLVKKVQIESCE